MRTKTLIGLTLLTLLPLWTFLSIGGPAFAQNVDKDFSDRVVYLDDDGKKQDSRDVKVETATYEDAGVKYLKGRSKSERNGSRIIMVLYGDTPPVYLEGEQNLQRGRFKEAASSFDGAKNAVDAGKCRPWVLEYAAVRRGQALTGLGRTEKGLLPDAVKEFKAALSANGKSILYDEIHLGLVEAYSLQGKWNEAKAAGQNLLNVGKIIKQPIWQAKAQAAIAQVLLEQKKFAEAVSAFGDLAALAAREGKYVKNERRKADLAELEISGAVEQGWALIAAAETTGAWDKAKSHFDGLAGHYPGNEAVAAAVLNGVGMTLMKTDPRAAYMKFCEAQVTNFNARTEVARALYLKAQALKAMGGATNNQRAEEALKELRKFYPDTPFARK
ncbi:MAG: hypothetical protein ABFS86_00960 [Planctomycetota bacterium]